MKIVRLINNVLQLHKGKPLCFFLTFFVSSLCVYVHDFTLKLYAKLFTYL